MSKFIDFDCVNLSGSAHCGENGEDSCAGAHVDYSLAFKGQLQQAAYDERCGLMVSGAECHFGIDHYIVGHRRDILVE